MENNNLTTFEQEFGLTVNEEGNITVGSKFVADKYGKRHDNVLAKIDGFIQTIPELGECFIKSFYVNEQNKQSYREYTMNKKGFEILISSFKNGKALKNNNDILNNAKNIGLDFTYFVRPEYNFLTILEDTFPNSKIQSQMPILKYKIDYYIPEGTIIIEYDENHHKYNKEKDEKRMLQIKKEIMRRIVKGIPIYEGEKDCCSSPWLKGKDITHVVRIEKGNEFKGLNEILKIMWQESVIDHVI